MITVAIIPARGGSKGIPGKNLSIVGGKPLIEHVLQAARSVPMINEILVSTDDPVIAWTAQYCNARVLHPRPAELCRDDVPTLPVLQHAVRYLEESAGIIPDTVILLYPTSPMLTPARIAEGLTLYRKNHLDSLASAVLDYGHYWMRQPHEDGYAWDRLYPRNARNRQQQLPLMRENGALYICSRDLLMEHSQILGGKIGFLVMDRWESIDIDEPGDLDIVRMRMQDYHSCA